MNPETLPQSLERLQAEWGLSDHQMAALLRVDLATFSRWMLEGRRGGAGGPTVPAGMDNAVPLVAVYKLLSRKFKTPEEQVKWLFTENADFGGNKPIDVAASSEENLFWVAYYLESSSRS